MQRIEVNGLVYEFEDDMSLMSLLDENADRVYEGIVTEEAPPNDPLTLEELREMDGEPVWIEFTDGYKYYNGWALVQVWAKSTNIIYLIRNNGSVLHPQVEIDCGGKIYRRKPEEGS